MNRPTIPAPHSSRRAFLQHSVAAMASLTALGAHGKTLPPTRPNVLLIMTDDQGYGDLSCLGNTVLSTPHLDTLHKESVRLSNFHVSPTCAPTRAALMTGRYNNRTGVWHTVMGRSILRRDETTLADYFANAGYRTGIFGKWHLGDNYPYRPEDRGFQEVLVHGGGGVGQTPDYWGNNYDGDTYLHNGVPTAYPGYCTDVWFQGAQTFMAAAPKAPFFCYLATNVPHSPYLVPREYQAPFEGKGLKPDQVAFYGMLKHFDGCMGKLLDFLDSEALTENTIFIFMTDNGTAAGDHGGMRGAKGSEYEGGHRVPCFIRWPAGSLGGGIDVPHVTAHIDVLPTLLELCGITSDTAKSLDGISLCDWLSDPTRPAPARTLVVDSQRVDHPEKWRKSAVIDKNWRLVNGQELYDIDRDAMQQHDIASEHPDVVARLRQAYDAWWEDSSSQFSTYCPLVVGAAGQGIAHLTGHDWHAPIEQLPWNQSHIRKGLVGNGYWVIDVATAGEYVLELRRWPRESKGTIRGVVDGGNALTIHTARFQIADATGSATVGDDDTVVTFRATLPKGEHQLHTTFIDEEGTERGAYYVAVGPYRP